jgi:DNA-binding NarL/FixJ family response regulator
MVDDHALIREALRSLKEVRRDAAVFEASDCRQAMKQITEHADIGLILLD